MEGTRLELIPMVSINEPDLPVRSTMDHLRMEELVDSMRDNGLLCPIAVKPVGDRYEIIYGHRRYVAARRLRWPEIRALVVTEPTLSVQAVRIHENAMREDVNPADEAIYLYQLSEQLNLNEPDLMKLTRRSQQWVADRFALIRGDQLIFQALREGAINFAVARELNRVRNPVLRKDYLHHAASQGVSSRVVHTWVENANSLPDQTVPAAPPEAPSADGVPAAPIVNECHYCGGDRDPQNMTHILVHTYCRDRIDKVLKQASEVKE